jgi:hypothetical protein
MTHTYSEEFDRGSGDSIDSSRDRGGDDRVIDDDDHAQRASIAM